MNATVRAKRMQVASDGMGIHVDDEDHGYVSVYFPDHDPVKGIEMFQDVIDQLQAIVLDRLIQKEEEANK